MAKPLPVLNAEAVGREAFCARGDAVVGCVGRSGRYIRIGIDRTVYAVSRSCGGMLVAGSVEGGRECEDGEWNAEGFDMGGGMGDGIIFEATFQKSSKLSITENESISSKTCYKLEDSRSFKASQIPSCSAFLSPVTRFVLPHLRKSASLSCAM